MQILCLQSTENKLFTLLSAVFLRSCFDQKCKLQVLLTFIPRLQRAEQVPSIVQKAQGDPKLDVQQHCSILTSHRLARSETMKGRRDKMGEANKLERAVLEHPSSRVLVAVSTY